MVVSAKRCFVSRRATILPEIGSRKREEGGGKEGGGRR